MTKAPVKKTAAKKTAAKKATPAKKAPAKKLPGHSPTALERVANPGAHALDTALLVQETAEKVARETAERVSRHYEAIIAELTATIDERTAKALKKVRRAAAPGAGTTAKAKDKKQSSAKKSGKAKKSKKK
jgi:hypothetical protein